MTKDMENGDVSFKIFGYADKANLVHIQNITRGGSEAKVGDIIWVYVNVTEKEADLSNAPEITINGKKARVFVNEPSVPSNTSTKYVGEIEVTEDMDIGEMTFEISAYTDRAGNVGNVLTSTTDGSSMTIVKD